jgi:GWxTD domain-containing protein
MPAAAVAALGLLFGSLSLGPACRTYNAIRRLAPAHADFLDKVDYIVTKDERRIFLGLPEGERDAFIAEFWKRRDPFPETPQNEFRTEYEDRVARAGTLFLGEGRPGWRTDRGRIYILFGPPQERQTFPMDAAGFCREVWYYGAFPVIFLDEHCSGYFVLRALNLEHLQELNIAQGHFRRTITEEGKFFDFEVSMQKTREEDGVYEGKVFVDIPYDSIWFDFKQGRLETTFEVRLEVTDPSWNPVWEARGTFPLSLARTELTENRKGRFRMEFPFRLDADLERLKSQKLRMDIWVKSSTGGDELKKAVAFELKS